MADVAAAIMVEVVLVPAADVRHIWLARHQDLFVEWCDSGGGGVCFQGRFGNNGGSDASD